jgi:type IV secretion system protein VirB2
MTTSVLTQARRLATGLETKATPWAYRALIGQSSALARLAIGGVMLVPALAHAQTVSGGASPATMINNICTFILGPFGQSLAVLGIIAIGLSWMFGRASLGLIAGVIGGIVIMFGASYLGQTLTGGSGG